MLVIQVLLFDSEEAMKKISIFNWVALGSVAVLTSSCGTYPSQPYSSASGATLTTGSTGGNNFTTTTVGKYTCPLADTNNVSPQYQVASTIAGYFRVCVDPSSAEDVLVIGSEGNSDQVCVFPTASTQSGSDQESVMWQSNPTTGYPWYVCQAASMNGSTFTFKGLDSWNSAYIVDGNSAQWMQGCLLYGPGTNQCPYWPQYSYGSFR
jgi:hypothetical protein